MTEYAKTGSSSANTLIFSITVMKLNTYALNKLFYKLASELQEKQRFKHVFRPKLKNEYFFYLKSGKNYEKNILTKKILNMIFGFLIIFKRIIQKNFRKSKGCSPSSG